jgi:hypothetical protein
MLPRCASSSDTVGEIKYKSKHLRFVRGSRRDAAPLARPVPCASSTPHEDLGAGWLAYQRWARSALTRAVAARLPKRRQAC